MGKVFCTEFRDMIVELHLVHGKSIKWLAEEYAVSTSTIGRWVTSYRNKRVLEAEKLSKGVPFDSSFLHIQNTTKGLYLQRKWPSPITKTNVFWINY
ncbi:MAG: transposase [Mogibacterium sp.]|nr:transposase [Mogibacterium sp.]